MVGLITVSGKCMCGKCEQRTQGIYRMVGYCTNCRTEPILMIFRVGDKAVRLDCPVCGNHAVEPQRRAADDEIPAALDEQEKPT